MLGGVLNIPDYLAQRFRDRFFLIDRRLRLLFVVRGILFFLSGIDWLLHTARLLNRLDYCHRSGSLYVNI